MNVKQGNGWKERGEGGTEKFEKQGKIRTVAAEELKNNRGLWAREQRVGGGREGTREKLKNKKKLIQI